MELRVMKLESEYADQKFDIDLDAFYVKFRKDVPYFELLRIFEHGYKTIYNYKAVNCLLNLEQLSIYDSLSAEYIYNTWFPTAEKLGIRFVAFVVPRPPLDKFSLSKHNKYDIVVNRITINSFYDEQDAYKWLKYIKKAPLKENKIDLVTQK
jgi:hypothetical protein